ncbi:hypothetical protein [Chromobacterium phragmitis]|uniref:hypothetical protein n=1 Tax=Chromobacterium phragmitis TaxID=2202141 RepID=UPI0011AE37F7|nr:hypothetical protein [Chromobacterium phragmitis]
MTTPKRRAPQGMQSDKPVPVRFSTEEKEELAEIADLENRSNASMVRIIYLMGLPHFKAARGLKSR